MGTPGIDLVPADRRTRAPASRQKNAGLRPRLSRARSPVKNDSELEGDRASRAMRLRQVADAPTRSGAGAATAAQSEPYVAARRFQKKRGDLSRFAKRQLRLRQLPPSAARVLENTAAAAILCQDPKSSRPSSAP